MAEIFLDVILGQLTDASARAFQEVVVFDIFGKDRKHFGVRHQLFSGIARDLPDALPKLVSIRKRRMLKRALHRHLVRLRAILKPHAQKEISNHLARLLNGRYGLENTEGAGIGHKLSARFCLIHTKRVGLLTHL